MSNLKFHEKSIFYIETFLQEKCFELNSAIHFQHDYTKGFCSMYNMQICNKCYRVEVISEAKRFRICISQSIPEDQRLYKFEDMQKDVNQKVIQKALIYLFMEAKIVRKKDTKNPLHNPEIINFVP